MKRYNLYKDTMHGIECAGGSLSTAWGLIRGECHKQRLPIPTMDKIEMIRPLTDEEMQIIRERQKREANG